jgi:2-acylglycerol O-acyltransferase 2
MLCRSSIYLRIGPICLAITPTVRSYLLVPLTSHRMRISSQVSLACKLPHSTPTHPNAEFRRGAMCNFANDSTGFSRGFPGVRPHLLTLNSNFTIPFYREILLFLGVCSVSKRSCERILRKGNGSAITIVVGGAAESLSAHPGTADLTLRKRCVFLSVA